MNLLPRFNFFLSMLPLSPPPGYFKEINSKFIWNDKCPRIKLTTLQRTNSAGGFPVAQMVEHGASSAKIVGSIPRESKS